MTDEVTDLRPATISTEPTTIDVQIDALTFDVAVAGDPEGAPAILLHGFPQNATTWRSTMAALAATGYYAIAPNQRGYSPGARPAQIDQYTERTLVQDVLDLARHFRFRQFHLIGHDLGAQLAWNLSARFPERVLSLSVLSRPHPAAFAKSLSEDETQLKRSGHHRTFQSKQATAHLLADDLASLKKALEEGGVAPEDATRYLEGLNSPEAMDAALNWYRAGPGEAPPRRRRRRRGDRRGRDAESRKDAPTQERPSQDQDPENDVDSPASREHVDAVDREEQVLTNDNVDPSSARDNDAVPLSAEQAIIDVPGPASDLPNAASVEAEDQNPIDAAKAPSSRQHEDNDLSGADAQSKGEEPVKDAPPSYLATNLAPFAVPTLYLWGTEDSTVGRVAAELTADYTKGPYMLKEINGAGHFLTDQQPERVDALILDHVQSWNDA